MRRPLRFRTIGSCVGGVLALGMGGCAVHPLPQNVSYANTVQIVRRVRCEAREGLEAAERKAALQGAQAVKHVASIVAGSSIGLEFEFEMSEANKADVSKIEFERAAAKQGESFKIEIDAALNRGHTTDGDATTTRKNTRFFRIVDDLKELRAARCGRSAREARPNLVHPVTGSTGMAEVVNTYIELELMSDLKVTKMESHSKKKLVTFSDTLEFTTVLDATASVDLQLDTAVGSLRLKRVTAAGHAARKDVHSVTVVLARDRAEIDPPDLYKNVRDKRLQTYLTQTRALSRNSVLIEFAKKRRARENKEVAERVLGVPLP